MSQTTTNPSNPIIPLNGLLDIQQHYLNDLERITTNANTNVSTSLSGIQNKLAQLNSSFANANTSASGILTEQDKIKEIIEKEYERISVAKDEIDNVHFGKMRSIQLNDSYRKRNMEYMRIVIAIIIALVIYVILAIFVPEPIYSISTIILFSVLFIYCAKTVWEIYKRENINYDRLDLMPPSDALSQNRTNAILSAKATAEADSSAKSASTVCVGESCCSTGSRWDASMNKCIISCSDPTKPISSGNTCIAKDACSAPSKLCGNACIGKDDICGTTGTNPFSTLGDERIKTKHDSIVYPYSPFEYSDYSKI